MKLLPQMVSFAALGLILAHPPAFGQSEQSILLLDPGGHTNQVRQALFTPGGKELISVGEDKVIRVWDTATGKQIGTIHGQIGAGPHDKLFAAALSRDGKTLAVAGNTYEGQLSAQDPGKNRVYVRIFHLDNLRAQPMAVTMTLMPGDVSIKTHVNSIQALAFSPADNNILASGSVDGAVCLWNVQTGKPLWDLDKTDDFHAGTVYGLAWSPDGKRFASASDDKTIHIWDADKAKTMKVLDMGRIVRSIAWSPDGKTLAAGMASDNGNGGCEIRLFTTDGFRKIGSWKQEDSVSSLAFSPDSQSLVSGQEGDDKTFPVTLWAVPSGRKIGVFNKHDADVTSVAFSDNGALVASAGGRSNGIYVWNWPSANVAQHLVGTGGEATDVAWSEQDGANGQPPTYKIEWKTNDAAQSHIFDLSQMQLLGKPYDASWPSAVTKTPDGETLRANDDGLSLTARVAGKDVSFPPPADKDDIDGQHDYLLDHSYGFTPGGETVVVGSRYKLALYRVKDGMLLRQFEGQTGPINSISVSPDGKYLASASSDQTVAIWLLPRRAIVDDAPVKPLLQLYAGQSGDAKSSDEFVAWNPEFGIYASSPMGQQLIGWQANNGEDQMADYITGASNFGTRNRRDILRLMLEKGNAEAGLLAAPNHPDGNVVLDEPLAKILAPQDGAKIGEAAVAVKVMVTPRLDNPITAVTVSVNKHPQKIVFPQDGTAPEHFRREGDHWIGEIPVTLRPGYENTLTALADGKEGTVESKPANVTVTSTLPRTTTHKLNVLAIGIAKYDRFVDLNYPDADALEIARVFKAQEGKVFSAVQTKTLVNGEATKKGIEDALAALQSKGPEMGDDDYTIVFVAGHGGDIGDNYYLIPADADTSSEDSVKQTAVNFSDLNDAMRGLRGNVLFFMDACRAGGGGGNENSGYSRVLDQAANRIIQGDSPVISFFSCMPTEFSQEAPAWRHGAFTRALIDGLSGAADANGDKMVSVYELQNYIVQHVPLLVASQEKKPTLPQTPLVLGAIVTAQVNLPLSMVGATTASETPVRLLAHQ